MTIEADLSAQPPRFQPDAALALRLASYSLLTGAALAQASPAVAQSVSIGPSDLPYTFPAPPGGDNVKGVTNQAGLDVNGDGTTDFTFTTFYANVFDPVVASSWTTIQVYANAASGNAVFAHKSKQPTSQLPDHLTRLQQRGNHGFPKRSGDRGRKGFTAATNYLLFYRKVRTGCATCTNINYRTMIYDDGKWSDQMGGGAVPFQLTSGGSTQFGWIHFKILGRTTQATIENVVIGRERSPASRTIAPVWPTRRRSSPLRLRDRMLALPLPDGSVPMTLGLLATGAAGNQLWRAAQIRIAELPTTR